MTDERKNTAIVVFGQKGFGKTTWIKYFVQANPQNKYLIFDHFNEWTIDKYSIEIHSISDLRYIVNVPWNEKHKVILKGRENFDRFWKFAATCRGWWIVFDEIDKCCSPSSLPDGLNEICQYGRHLGVSFIAASRRPARVHRNITSQADHIICFRISEPRDIKYIAEYAGADIAEQLSTLQVGEYVKYPETEIVEGYQE